MKGFQGQAQVSEPSLFGYATPLSKESFIPRANISPASPVKGIGFIPQLTPPSAARKTRYTLLQMCV